MPLHELLFVMEYNLAKEFPALSPFEIEVRSFLQVVALYSDVRQVQIAAKKEEEKRNDPNRIIRRPAGDDWF